MKEVRSIVLHNSEGRKSKGKNAGFLWNAKCSVIETFGGVSNFPPKENSAFCSLCKGIDHCRVRES